MTDAAYPPPNAGQSRLRYMLMAITGIVIVMTAVVLYGIVDRLADARWGQTESIMTSEGGATVLTPPRPLSDFTLIAHTGEPLSLSDLRGQRVVLSFGYTHCPDVCPLTLMVYDRIHDLLGEQADDVAFVFITVDSERDNVDRLSRYLDTRNVDDFALALTGNEGDLRRLGVDYGLYFEQQAPLNGDARNYAVDHTASTFMIDDEGRLEAIFGFGTEPLVIYDYLIDRMVS